jgi:IMP dehydrogenase / GMP reductase domain
MPKILKSKSIYYSDVNLIAQPGTVKSRSEIPKRLDLIYSSPMSSICGPKFVKTSLELGISVCLHRFCSIEYELNLFKDNYDYSSRIWSAISLGDNNRFLQLYKQGCRNFLIDTANGYLKTVVDYTHELYNDFKNINIIVGNIHSNKGLRLYNDIPNIGLRVGISNGGGCNTKLMTSINRGQITELVECYESNDDSIIYGDGGIHNPAYAALAFACGADRIILGSYFSKAEESESVQNGEYKFWGSASYKQLELSGIKRQHSEGKILEIDKKEIKPLKILIDELWGGISSAISYSGFNNIDNFIGNGEIELKV